MNPSGLTASVLCVMAAGATAPALGQVSPFRRPPDQGSAPPPGTLRESPAPTGPGLLYIPEQPGNTLLITEFLGRAVYGPGKQKVGTIANLLVDTTGRVVGVVLDVGGVLGIGAKEVAISFEALYPVRENDQEAFVVEMTAAQLTVAPAFKRSR